SPVIGSFLTAKGWLHYLIGSAEILPSLSSEKLFSFAMSSSLGNGQREKLSSICAGIYGCLSLLSLTPHQVSSRCPLLALWYSAQTVETFSQSLLAAPRTS